MSEAVIPPEDPPTPDLADTAEAKGFAAVLRAMETASTTADASLVAVAAIINGGHETEAFIGHDGENLARLTRLLAVKASAELRSARERRPRGTPTTRSRLLETLENVLTVAWQEIDDALMALDRHDDTEIAGDA